jgi:hypothetical protein
MKGFQEPVAVLLYSADRRVRAMILNLDTKKTTHRFDRRLVESVSVSTADVIRIPN